MSLMSICPSPSNLITPSTSFSKECLKRVEIAFPKPLLFNPNKTSNFEFFKIDNELSVEPSS